MTSPSVPSAGHTWRRGRYAPGKNIQKDIVNIDFSCKYTGGDFVTSDESLDVKWVRRDEALDLVTFPLTKKRLENMLSVGNTVNCFNFKKEPFEVVAEEKYTVGR